MLDQTIINAVFAGLGAVLAFILRIIWEGLRDLQPAGRAWAARRRGQGGRHRAI